MMMRMLGWFVGMMTLNRNYYSKHDLERALCLLSNQHLDLLSVYRLFNSTC